MACQSDLSDLFSIVEFPEDESVEVISSSWLDGSGSCSWPPLIGKKLSMAVQHHITPGRDWMKYPARVLRMYGKQFL